MELSYQYKDPSLVEQDNKEDKRKAWIGAITFAILVLVLIFWRFFSKLDPLPEPGGGVAASFGNVEIAGSGSASVTKESNTPKNDLVEEVETDDNFQTTTIRNDKPSTQNNTQNNSNPTPVEEGLNFGSFQGNGNQTGNGRVGTEDGDPNLPPAYGNGKGGSGTGTGRGNGSGTGDGPGEGGAGTRKCVSNCSTCNVPSNWSEVGVAHVSILIDANGDVIESNLADPKKFQSNANFFGEQKKLAEKCARQRKYDRASSNSRQVVRITFKKG